MEQPEHKRGLPLAEFVAELAVKQDKLRTDYANRDQRKPLLPIAEARARAPQTDWATRIC